MNRKPRVTFGYGDISLTHHARQRGYERLGITSDKELRKIASAAKKKGLDITLIGEDNCNKFGIPQKTVKAWRQAFKCKSNVNQIFFYKGLYYVFNGFKSRTLTTIIQTTKGFPFEWNGVTYEA